MPRSHFLFVTVAIVAAIAIAWVLVARHLHLPILAFQTSSNLLLLGAMNGVLADNGEWWRRVTSQFLHVYFMHMLCNLCAIALLARFALIRAVVIVAIQFALDVYVSGSIKPGHSVGFAAGMLFALAAQGVKGRSGAIVPTPSSHF